MDKQEKPSAVPPRDPTGGDTSATDRRRIGRIVHDERGAATLEWQTIPVERTGRFERLALAIETGDPSSGPRPASRSARGYNPYERVGGFGTAKRDDTSQTRRDLRKLSEWIKLRREIEARKTRDDTTED